MKAAPTNITIHVKGFGWEWCHYAWSKNGQLFTVKELAQHLEWIVREEKKRKLTIPTKPNPKVPQRKKTGILSMPTNEIAELDKK